MADSFDMLASVKTALGIAGDYLDNTIQLYVDEVNEYLAAAGVPSTAIGTRATVGVVTRGVADIWNYGGGGGALSSYFYERVIQLATGLQSASGDGTAADNG